MWRRGAHIAAAQQGAAAPVAVVDINSAPFLFDPVAPRGPLPWAGDRSSVIVYAVCGAESADAGAQPRLRALAFRITAASAMEMREQAGAFICSELSEPTARCSPPVTVSAETAIMDAASSSVFGVCKIAFHMHGAGPPYDCSPAGCAIQL